MAELNGIMDYGDDEIIKRIGHGDAPAEEELVRRYGGFILSLAHKLGLSESDAEEIANDVLLESIEQARGGHLKTASSLRPWLRKVTRNRVIDRYRRNETSDEHDRAVVEELRLALDGAGSTNDEQQDSVYPYKLVVVRQALQRLRKRVAERGGAKPETSDVQVLIWIAHGVTNEEIAQYLGSTENAARQRRHRALERLKEEMTRLQDELNEFVEDL